MIIRKRKYNFYIDDREYLYIDLVGEDFCPYKVQKQTGLRLVQKVSKGKLCGSYPKKSPLFGEISSVGSAILQAPKRITYWGQRPWLLRQLARFQEVFRANGVTSISFWVVRYRPPDSQQNYEFSSSSMEILVRANASICISAYDVSRQKICSMPVRLFPNDQSRHLKCNTQRKSRLTSDSKCRT